MVGKVGDGAQSDTLVFEPERAEISAPVDQEGRAWRQESPHQHRIVVDRGDDAADRDAERAQCLEFSQPDQVVADVRVERVVDDHYLAGARQRASQRIAEFEAECGEVPSTGCSLRELVWHCVMRCRSTLEKKSQRPAQTAPAKQTRQSRQPFPLEAA